MKLQFMPRVSRSRILSMMNYTADGYVSRCDQVTKIPHRPMLVRVSFKKNTFLRTGSRFLHENIVKSLFIISGNESERNSVDRV